MLAERFRVLAQRQRLPDRAQIHFIPKGAFPGLEYYDWEDYTVAVKVLEYLEGKKTDLVRGDIIVVEEQLSNEGFNYGKFAFDGENVISWEIDPNNYKVRFLPREFQVIKEFTLQYWVDAYDYDRDMIVPFSFRDNLFGQDLMVLNEPEGEVIPFLDDKGTKYHIIIPGSNIQGIGGSNVEQDLQHIMYFEILSSDDERLSKKYDPRFTLLLPSVSAIYDERPEITKEDLRRDDTLRNVIVRALGSAVQAERSIDLTYMTSDGKGIREIYTPSVRSDKIRIDEGIYVSRERAHEMEKILNLKSVGI